MPWKRKKENANKQKFRRYYRKRKLANTESLCKDSNNQYTSKNSLESTGNKCNCEISKIETVVEFYLNYI